MRRLLLAIITASLLSAAPAFAEKAIKIGLGEDPDILDPTLGRTTVGRIVFTSICDKLFDINANLEIVPQLALSSEIIEGGKSVVIKLRPGVKFHDGEPMDAAAVKYTIDRHLTMEGSFRKQDIGVIKEVIVVDPLTVRLDLKEPFAPLINQLADRPGMIISPKAAKAAGDKFGLHPVCAGPYRFVERVQQDRIVVEKFKDYWDAANVDIDKITYQPIADASVRLSNLKAGTLDVIERVLSTDIDDIRGTKGIELASGPALGFQMITFNMRTGDKGRGAISTDKRIRKAFELAIDRDALNQVVFNGEFKPGNQWQPVGNYYYQETFPVPRRDVKRAAELLKESGVPTPFAVDLMVPNNPEIRQVAEVLQAMTAEAGFDVKIRTTEHATALTQADQGQFDAYIVVSNGRVDPDGNVFQILHTGTGSNYAGYSNPELDALLEKGRTVVTQEERKEAYRQATAIVLEENPVIYLYHRLVTHAHTSKVKGLQPIADGLIRVKDLKLAD